MGNNGRRDTSGIKSTFYVNSQTDPNRLAYFYTKNILKEEQLRRLGDGEDIKLSLTANQRKVHPIAVYTINGKGPYTKTEIDRMLNDGIIDSDAVGRYAVWSDDTARRLNEEDTKVFLSALDKVEVFMHEGVEEPDSDSDPEPDKESNPDKMTICQQIDRLLEAFKGLPKEERGRWLEVISDAVVAMPDPEQPPVTPSEEEALRAKYGCSKQPEAPAPTPANDEKLISFSVLEEKLKQQIPFDLLLTPSTEAHALREWQQIFHQAGADLEALLRQP